MDDTTSDDLYRQPEDYDFQESIACDLGTCYCEWFNQLSKQCEQEDYILDSLRDRSWADPLDNRAWEIARGAKGCYRDAQNRLENGYRTRLTTREIKRIRLAREGKLQLTQKEINKALRHQALGYRHVVVDNWCGTGNSYYYSNYDRVSGLMLPDGEVSESSHMIEESAITEGSITELTPQNQPAHAIPGLLDDRWRQ